MDDDAIAIEAIADRFKQALKPFEYREYSQSSKGRLLGLEWCALVDLDNEASAARGAFWSCKFCSAPKHCSHMKCCLVKA